MKFYISLDLEGIAGVAGSKGNKLNNSPQYAYACRQAVKEVNAAARALFDSGADEVVVYDGHGGSLNIDISQVDERCLLAVGGLAEHRLPGLDSSFDGMLLIGYHPMEGTLNGVIAHTFSSSSYDGIWINNIEVGEIAVDALIADEKGNVPVIFVSSDDKGVKEAKSFLPWIETVETKKGLGWNTCLSKHPVMAEKEIYEAVKKAVNRIADMKTYKMEKPLEVRYKFKRIDAADDKERKSAGRYERIDAKTVKAVFDSILELF